MSESNRVGRVGVSALLKVFQRPNTVTDRCVCVCVCADAARPGFMASEEVLYRHRVMRRKNTEASRSEYGQG